MQDKAFRYPPRRPTLMAANAMYLLGAAGLVAIAAITSAVMLLTGTESIDPFGAAFAWLQVGSSVLLFFAPPVIYALKKPGAYHTMRLASPAPSAMLLALISAPLAAFALLFFNHLWVGLLEAMGGTVQGSAIPAPTTGSELLKLSLIVGVAAGVCEEMMFRGAILAAYERRGTRYAMVVSSLMFAAIHGSVAGFPSQAAMGLILAYVVISTGSLYVGMLYHSVYNISLLVVSHLAVSMPAPTEAEAALAIDWGAVMINLVFCGALLLGTLALFARMRVRRGIRFEQVLRPDREKMPWRELLVLMVAVITVMAGYVLDLGVTFGWWG